MTRSKKIFNNIVLSFGLQILMFVFSLVIKRLFIMRLPIEYLGVSDLITTFYNSLLLVNVGFTGIYIYNLYKPLNENNEDELVKYINVYQKLFDYISYFVLFVSLCMSPFILNIFNFGIEDSLIIYVIYFTELAAIFTQYKLMYKVSILRAGQDEYFGTMVSIFVNIIAFACKLVSIAVFNSFILYCISTALQSIFINVLTYYLVDKKYKFARIKKKTSFKDVINSGVLTQSKKYMVRTMHSLVYYSMDNYLIAYYFTSNPISYISNYMMIIVTANSFITSIFASISGSIANFKHNVKNVQSYYEISKAFVFLNYLMSLLVVVGFHLIIDDFIKLWLGENYLIDGNIVVILSLILMTNVFFSVTTTIFNIEGYMLKEKMPLVLSAATNLVFSVFLVKVVGISGIYIGTLLGNIVFYSSKLLYVSYGVFNKYKTEFISIHLMYLGLILLQIVVFDLTTNVIVNEVDSLISLIYKISIVIFQIAIVNFLIFRKSKSYKLLINSLKEVTGGGKQ